MIRFIFSWIGGYIASTGNLIGVGLYGLSIFLNDELIRRIFRHKGVIVFSGTDGSGKTTQTKKLQKYLQNKGFKVTIFHYHKYLFIEKISHLMRKNSIHPGEFGSSAEPRDEKKSHKMRKYRVKKTSKLSLLRPYLALLDNYLSYFIYVLPKIIRNEIIICDRFIWDSYVKHYGLGYQTKGLFRLSTLIKPKIGFMFTTNYETSRKRLDPNHVIYYENEFIDETLMFSKIAKTLNYPIINTGILTKKQVWNISENEISSNFVKLPVSNELLNDR